MKKTPVCIMMLLLCVTVLTSCADIGAQQSILKLDQFQAQFEKDGYEYTRLGDADVTSFAESLAAESGVLLKSKITGVIEYSYRDASTGKTVYGIVVGTTNRDDSKAVSRAYVEMLKPVLEWKEWTTSNFGFYTQIEYSLS